MTTMLTASEPRTGAIKVSVPYSGKAKEIEVDFDDLNQKETTRIGRIYPDIGTQASRSIEGIEMLKSNMLNSVFQLISVTGSDIIEAQIDAIVGCMTSELDYVQDNLSEHFDWFQDIHHKVCALAEVAKVLIFLYLERYSMKINMEHIEHAQKGVLL